MPFSSEFREIRCGEGRILPKGVIEILPHFLHFLPYLKNYRYIV
jgi:hypothetical protein